MQIFRRRLASCALFLMALQMALVFTAPLTACCTSRLSPSVAEEEECCPAGTHPPGQCPRHARTSQHQTQRQSTSCRLLCDAPHGAQFILGVTGLMPAPAVAAAPATITAPVVIAAPVELVRASSPISPPPRLG